MRKPLPETGTPWPQLKARMDEYAAGDVAWREGKTAVYVFNAGPEVEQDRRHFQRGRAGMREQRLAGAGRALQPLVAAPGVRAIAGQVAVAVGVGDVVELAARHVGPVEGNGHGRVRRRVAWG